MQWKQVCGEEGRWGDPEIESSVWDVFAMFIQHSDEDAEKHDWINDPVLN